MITTYYRCNEEKNRHSEFLKIQKLNHFTWQLEPMHVVRKQLKHVEPTLNKTIALFFKHSKFCTVIN